MILTAGIVIKPVSMDHARLPEPHEWKALCAYHDKTLNPPEEPPPLGVAMRMVAKIGGFLGRKSDGHPGADVLWRGLDKLSVITEAFQVFHPAF
ncbi:MAG: hypothetical protein N838_28580 [Thiohalocapsa sp. PB-PSB1]|nr:MAG: hypothetical protein N838_28580 [Thiohalocapsa sp. PB-PSB1]